MTNFERAKADAKLLIDALREATKVLYSLDSPTTLRSLTALRCACLAVLEMTTAELEKNYPYPEIMFAELNAEEKPEASN